MTLLKGIPARKEDEERIKSLNLDSSKINFVLVVDESKQDALAYVKQIEKFLDKLSLSYEEVLVNENSNADDYKNKFQDKKNTIILARPLPKAFITKAIGLLPSENDPDCLSTESAGHIFLGDGPLPATAMSVMKVLDFYNIDVTGKKALVIGRSQSVGLPIALGLLKRNALVSIAHSKVDAMTLDRMCSEADIVVLASGQRGLVSTFKKGQILIDCGYHAQDNGGDLGFVPQEDQFDAYTPVPGGIGPLTISSLVVSALIKKGLL